MEVKTNLYKLGFYHNNIFRLQDWSQKHTIVRLDKSHPDATFSIQTYEESIRSEFSKPIEIFR